MALTRIKAGQISDIDYKQAVRVITLSNITLAGSAPDSVDGINLAANDRILVAGQDTGSQNGLYYVQTLGTGSNGTWVRTSDGNETGEIQAGMIVMVTEGDTYKDTQWKLTTNDPIVVGTTPLVFEQNSAYAFGNIYANGTAVLSSAVGGTVTFTPGTGMIISANNTTKTITFAATGGGGGSGGNVTVSATPPGSPSVGDWWIDADDATPYLYYAATNNGLASQWAETDALYSFSSSTGGGSGSPGGNTTEVQYNSGGNFAGSPNFTFDGTDVTISGNLTTSNILPLGNVTQSLGSTSYRWKDLWIANSSIYMGDIIIGTVGNVLTINGANVVTGNTGAPLSTSGNVVAGNVTTTGQVTATSNITGGNLLTGGLVSATSTITSAANITGGNLLTGGLVSATSTITSAANVIGGNITTAGIMTSTGNAIAGNVLTGGLVSATGTITSAANITGGNVLTGGLISATSSITSANGITATANITGGNITTAGIMTSTGNAIHGNILTGGLISAAGNITGGNILGGANVNATTHTGSTVSVTSNVTAGNVLTGGAISATGNITGGNIHTAGIISSAGNLVAGNVYGNLLTVNTAGASGNTGDIGWNTAEATFNMYLENGVVLQAGQEQNFWVIASGNINNGQIAAFAGAANNAIIASAANAAAPGFNAEYVIGVATQDILDGELGYVTTYGKVREINTNAFNVGDILYLDPNTPGGYVNTVPAAPNPKVQVAAVLQKGVADGCIVVRPTIFSRLENLQDVDAAAVSNKDYLRFTTTGNLWQHAELDISDDSSPVLGGNLEGNNFNIANVTNYSGGNLTLTGAAYATGAITVGTQLATKAYVDTQVSTGLHIHEPVVTEAATALNATYATGGTTQTVDQISGNKTLTFTTSPGLAVNDVIVFTNSFNGITSGTAYFVYSTNGTNQITLSSTYGGTEITTLTNGGPGLAQASRANSGVGATLTNAGANAAINIGNVALSVNDRVLVTTQANAAHNGVYVVSTAGNATVQWVMTRSSDANKYGPQDPNELGGGDYFFVTSGDSAGESYVCSNDTTIVFGTTNITFTLFSASPTYTGTSPIVVTGQVISLANTTGLGDVVVLQNTPTLTTPNIGAATGTSISVTANVTSGNVVTGGVITAIGNITAGNVITGGTVNAASFTGASISVSGNVDGANLRSGLQITAVGNIQGGNLLTAGLISATANITAGNVLTGGLMSAAGNVTGSYIFGNGSQLTGISTSTTKIFNGTSEANIGTSNGNANITIGGTSNVAVFASTGLYVTGLTSVTANVIAGNVTTAGLISAAGNVNAGNLVISGGITDTGSGFVLNTTTVSNITLAPNSSNVLVATTTGVNVTGALSASGNIDAGNLRTAGLITATGTINSAANITGGNLLTAGLISATSTITSAANVIGGNITTAGIMTSTGNAIAGNVLTGGLVSATGTITSAANITGGNLLTSGVVSATSTVSDSIGDVREIVQNSQSGATYTLAATDIGKHINYTGATGNVAIPASIFSAGDAVTIYNNQAANITVIQNTGVTLRLAGTATTGNRTMLQYGLSTVLCVAANTFVISGGGLL